MRIFTVVDIEDGIGSIHQTLEQARHFALVEHPVLYKNSPWIKAPAFIAEADRETKIMRCSRKEDRNILLHKACIAFHALTNDFTPEQARAGQPMTAEQVRPVIAELRARNRSKAARIRMAELAVERAKVTPEAREVWRSYLAMETA